MGTADSNGFSAPLKLFLKPNKPSTCSLTSQSNPATGSEPDSKLLGALLLLERSPSSRRNRANNDAISSMGTPIVPKNPTRYISGLVRPIRLSPSPFGGLQGKRAPCKGRASTPTTASKRINRFPARIDTGLEAAPHARRTPLRKAGSLVQNQPRRWPSTPSEAGLL